MIRFLLMMIFSYLVFKLIARFLGPIADRMWGTGSRQNDSNPKDNKVNIDFTKKPSDKESKVGEYVKYEEIK
ncbi:MAG: hypothetical protein ACJATA_001238 [Sphingobacteriales bacterium]|jgi:hypothetical protein